MKNKWIVATAVALTLAACSNAEQASENTSDDSLKPVQELVSTGSPKIEGADLSTLPSGLYKSESGHAYITFQYLHQGYSRPTLRWNNFEATADLNAEDLTKSKLNVVIQSDSIDSGVAKFDTHLKSADMFEVEAFPTITFQSTNIDQNIIGAGELVGDLTMKGVTKPITLKAFANKVGESRDGTPMFGISATTSLKRSDWNLGYAVPYVGEDVDIKIEVEFLKAE